VRHRQDDNGEPNVRREFDFSRSRTVPLPGFGRQGAARYLPPIPITCIRALDRAAPSFGAENVLVGTTERLGRARVGEAHFDAGAASWTSEDVQAPTG
jgi:hypothetical protein